MPSNTFYHQHHAHSGLSKVLGKQRKSQVGKKKNKPQTKPNWTKQTKTNQPKQTKNKTKQKKAMSMQVETFIKLTYNMAKPTLDKSCYFTISEGETNNMSTLNNMF